MSPLKLAKRLRAGEALFFCDSTLSYANGKFLETSMGYDGHYGHGFYDTRPSWRAVRQWLKNGAYR